MLIKIFLSFPLESCFFLSVKTIRTACAPILFSEPAYSLGKSAGLFCHRHCALCKALQYFLYGELNVFC